MTAHAAASIALAEALACTLVTADKQLAHAPGPRGDRGAGARDQLGRRRCPGGAPQGTATTGADGGEGEATVTLCDGCIEGSGDLATAFEDMFGADDYGDLDGDLTGQAEAEQ
ncbi:MAG: hypothetical protein ACRDZN_07720 [Acidimicrobiales bacterium]